MSRIEVNSNDLELLNEELTSLGKQTKNLTDFVQSNFKICKNNGLYTAGLTKVSNLFEALGDDSKMLNNEMKIFGEELSNIEDVFSRKFSEIKSPSVELFKVGLVRPTAPPVPPTIPPTQPPTIAPPVPTFVPAVPTPTIGSGSNVTGASGDIDVVAVAPGREQTVLRDMSKTRSQWDNKQSPVAKQSPAPVLEEPVVEDELSKIMTEAEDVMSGITDTVSHSVSDTMSSLGGEI